MAAITFADSPLACIRCARADFDLSSASGLPMCWPRARHLLRRDSGWRDLNPRPLRPERRHLSVCRPGAALELLKTAGYSVEVGYVQRGGHETLRTAPWAPTSEPWASRLASRFGDRCSSCRSAARTNLPVASLCSRWTGRTHRWGCRHLSRRCCSCCCCCYRRTLRPAALARPRPQLGSLLLPHADRCS
jgi:hypothetical protein